MKSNSVIHRILAVLLTLCLIAPGAAMAGGKSGKKNFREGLKYEQVQQWDIAAQQFALAVAAEPNNPEYKLHYIRALQQASIMYVKRGDDLAEQGDYPSAYSAYRQAYNYDQGNEIARMKMERMLEQQKAQASGGEAGRINNIANYRPTGNEVQIQSRPRGSRDVIPVINFRETKLKTVVLNLGRQLGLNVVFDESVKDVPVTIDLTDVTVAKALDIILKTYKFTFEQVDRRTILIYADNPTNRPRFESLMIKTFYLGNITAQQARTALQQLLPPGRQLASLDGGNNAPSNLLIVKATATELQLIQDILNSLDKNKNEVVLDVEIYEISHDSALQIGNQITPESENGLSLSNLGGVSSYIEGTGNPARNLAAIGTSGALIGLPLTSLSLLQSKGNSKLLYRTQVHALDGQKNTTKVGRSVPVRVGTTYPSGGFIPTGTPTPQSAAGAAATSVLNQVTGQNFGGIGGIDNIQYRDVGLVIDAKPTITNEGYVEVEMSFETSDVVASGVTASLTPTFTQRSLKTTARMQDGVTAIVAGVNQEVKGDSRSGIPVVGMLPILGRFFTAPRQTNTQSDIVITVTPHIVRSQGINKDDYLAKAAGQMQAGPTPSVEEVVYRAQQEDEQERRLIAQQIPSQSVPLTTPSQVNSTQLAGFDQSSRSNSQPTIQPVVNTKQQKVINDRTLVPVPSNANSVPAGLNPYRAATPVYSGVPEGPPPPGSQEIPAANGSASDNPQAEKQADKPQPDKGQPDKTKEGEQPDLSSLITQPSGPVSPATVISSSRPENVEREIARMRTEAVQKAELEKASKQQAAPTEDPNRFWVAQGQQQKAAQAAPRMAETSRNSSTVAMSLSPKPIRQQLGKTFTVTVEVTSQAQMTGANIALKFDESKLRIKSVRDAGMLGPQPDLSYEVVKGNLVVKVKQAQASPVKASGRLILIEFAAIAEGQSEIAFNNSDTQVKMAGNASASAIGTATQVLISRDTLTSIPNER